MKFYTDQHQHYCGIDLHARQMYVCILDAAGKVRRRCHMMHKRSELITHIQNTVSQYNLPPFEGRLGQRCQREGLLAHFPDPQVRNSIALDLAMIEQYDALLPKLERHIRACAKQHDRKAFTLLRSIHGADPIIPLVILYEICTIERVPRVQDFVSYCRLVKPGRESNGKLLGHAGGKIGNAHLSRSRFTRVIPSCFTTAR